MKKVFIAFICLLSIVHVEAQKNMDGLINAEKSFAAFAKNHSTKNAFLAFMDSNAIMFDKGKVVNGFDLWSARKENKSLLSWWPRVASIAASGDYGFTTGPWTFQRTAQDTIIATGQYSTVWHLNKNGEWKFLVDFGIGDTPPVTDTLVKIIPGAVSKVKGSIANLENTDKEFNNVTDIKARYKKYISSDFCTLNRDGVAPARAAEQYASVLQSTPDSIQYTFNGSNIAPSGDLGFTYGTTVVAGKTDNYLRIWRNEKEGWKLALEVLHY